MNQRSMAVSLIAFVSVMSPLAAQEPLEFLSECDAACDNFCGDTAAGLSGYCKTNLSSTRATVGSLFRWSSSPAASSLAQPNDPVVTDRPDFTEASSVVGLGVLQIESGYTYTYDNDGTRQSIGHSYPETLFRYGAFANWLELRFALNFVDESIGGTSTSATDDLYLGAKIGLTPQDGIRPEMALIPQMSIGVDRPAGANSDVLPGLNWLYGWDLSDILSAAGSTQFNLAIDEGTDNSYTEWAQSGTIGYTLTDKLSAYTEYYGFYPAGADTARVEHYFNGGFAYGITNDIQWDIRGGQGLNDAADDYFFGTGLTVRFR